MIPALFEKGLYRQTDLAIGLVTHDRKLLDGLASACCYEPMTHHFERGQLKAELPIRAMAEHPEDPMTASSPSPGPWRWANSRCVVPERPYRRTHWIRCVGVECGRRTLPAKFRTHTKLGWPDAYE